MLTRRMVRNSPAGSWAAVVLACVLAAACSDDSPTPPPYPATVSIVAPSELSFTIGDTLRLAAEIRDQWGTDLPGPAVTWSSSDAQVASVGPSGLVTATGTGTATITATAGDATGSVQLAVADPAYAVLVALYMKTGGDDWTNNDNWLDGTDLGTWYGVETDSAGRVASLNLADNNLTGGIPPDLGDLASLGHLDLSGNRLKGAIPGELGALDSLRYLRLSVNDLTGEMPAELGTLELLSELDLRANALTGEIPPELGGLANLEALDLSANDLMGGIPSELGDLQQLKAVSLFDNDLTGEIPEELGGIPGLKELRLGDNALTGEIPRALGDLGELEELWISHNALTGEIPAELGGMDSLKVLRLSHNQLSGRLPIELGALPGLGTLLVGDNPLSGSLPLSLAAAPIEVLGYANTELCVLADESFREWLDGVPVHDGTGVDCPPVLDRDVLVTLYHATDGDNWVDNENWLTDAPLGEWYGVDTDVDGRVVKLDLSGNWDGENEQWVSHGLVGQIPSRLGDLPNLVNLSLHANDLTGPIPAELGGLANLMDLSLSSNDLSGPIPPELGSLANLTLLNLRENSLSGPIPPELGNLSNLVELSLNANDLSEPIPAELGDLANLVNLGLHANGLAGPIPPALGNLAGLERLNLSENLLSGSIPPELGNLSNLSTLNLGNNELAGPIPPQLGNLANLTTLTLSNNPDLAGRLPLSLVNVPLATFGYGGTALCVPADEVFQQWLDGIQDHSGTGVGCADLSDRAILEVLYKTTDGRNWADSENWLTDEPLSAWFGVQTDSDGRVTRLSLPANELAGPLPPGLGGLDSLVVLSLRENALTGPVPLELGHLARLDSLLLQTNNLTGAIPPEFGRLEQLEVLRLDDNVGLTGALPLSLADIPLSLFYYSGTDLCVPRDAAFRLWLDGIGDHEGTDVDCPAQFRLDFDSLADIDGWFRSTYATVEVTDGVLLLASSEAGQNGATGNLEVFDSAVTEWEVQARMARARADARMEIAVEVTHARFETFAIDLGSGVKLGPEGSEVDTNWRINVYDASVGGWTNYAHGSSEAIRDDPGEFTNVSFALKGDSLRFHADGTLVFADKIPQVIRESGRTDLNGVVLVFRPIGTAANEGALFDWLDIQGHPASGASAAAAQPGRSGAATARVKTKFAPARPAGRGRKGG